MTFFLSSFYTVQADTTDYYLESQGIRRTFKVYIPRNIDRSAPLILALHGYGGKNDPTRFGMNKTAEKYGFVMCYPQGEKDGKGKTCWNVGYPFQKDMKINDVEFLVQLVDYLQKKYNLSKRNVFCTGISNGGEMCYQLAVQKPKVFRALAPISGLMLSDLKESDKSKVPVSIFEIHGTADKTSWWEGDPQNKGGWGSYLSVPAAVTHWAEKNKCKAPQIDTLIGKAPDHRKIVSHRYTGGVNKTEVWLYEMIGVGHSFADQDIDRGEEIWRFFSRFLLRK